MGSVDRIVGSGGHLPRREFAGADRSRLRWPKYYGILEAPVEKVEETTPVVEAISEAPSAEDLEEKVVEPEAVKEAAPEVKVTEEETIASAADEKAEATSDDKDSESSKEE